MRSVALRRSSWRTGTDVQPDARSSPSVVGLDSGIASHPSGAMIAAVNG